ncbi:recombinase family protein [Cryptosporangium aurantiacum]|uniref:Recombinase n=1 Tax=Cryptosporangium aurantiacum TaxID=134849 RepID=A0A1M7R2Y4_9ACTN|nr:recombinase family protein [Cryptosporangium aurantiacum]SHN39439.1 Recombinase [Cryptosporangium aurantiacum]
MPELNPTDHDGSPLGAWLQHNPTRSRPTAPSGGSRSAFYARMSTREFQDPESSTGWQRQVATDLITGHGRIAAEFIDVGCSRRRSWTSRPEAAALLESPANPDRQFDAVVVGEYERAFCGQQSVTFCRCSPAILQIWLPEFHGPVDPADPVHQAQPDPETSRHVRRIFAQQLTGRSVASIARELNETGVPCPSVADPGRNRNRRARPWTVRTVASILTNPRFTGRAARGRSGHQDLTRRDRFRNTRTPLSTPLPID